MEGCNEFDLYCPQCVKICEQGAVNTQFGPLGKLVAAGDAVLLKKKVCFCFCFYTLHFFKKKMQKKCFFEAKYKQTTNTNKNINTYIWTDCNAKYKP